MENKPKIIVIIGPTASGKTALAIKIARKFNGEIVSADSRQIYRGMDIGTGKATKQEQHMAKHWLLDIVSPKTNFNAALFKQRADKAIANILKNGKLPIIAGGTGFWIKAIIDNIEFPNVKPDWKLRAKLGKKTAQELFKMLEKIDPERAANIDAKNKVRLIRAIEIANSLGKVAKALSKPKYDALKIGIKFPKIQLQKRIKIRLDKRLKEGMIIEVKRLHNQGVSWKRLESFGLEYRWIARYLQGKMTLVEMKQKLFQEIKNYAKRQMTWFSAQGGPASGGKKDKRIYWIKKEKEAEKLVRNFIGRKA